MKDHDANRHPGPWRVMRVDSEFAGILVAVGFLVLGSVSMPIGTWFVLGCLVLGGAFALLLRYTPKKFIGLALGALVVLVVLVLWWAGRPPQRPHSVSSSAFMSIRKVSLFGSTARILPSGPAVIIPSGLMRGT